MPFALIIVLREHSHIKPEFELGSLIPFSVLLTVTLHHVFSETTASKKYSWKEKVEGELKRSK